MQRTRSRLTTFIGIPFGAAALLLAGCGGDHRPAEPSPTPAPATIALSDGTRFAPGMTGTWRVLGQGSYLQISADTMRRYHETPSYCYPASAATDARALADLTVTREAGGRVDLFDAPDTPASMQLQRVSALPARCLAPAPAGPAATAQALCEVLEQHYPFFRERGIDWAARCAQLKAEAAQARNDAELQAALIRALDGFDDEHVNLAGTAPDALLFNAGASATTRMLKQLYSAQEGSEEFESFGAFREAWRARLQAAAAERLTERHEGLNGAVVWGRLPGNIGYLSLNRMIELSAGGSLAADLRAAGEEIDRVVAALADTRAMIVDVTVNDGGYDAVSATIAARFADRRRLAFTTQVKQEEGAAPLTWYLEPRGARQYAKPVYLLTSDQTISAGETFVLMMRTLPQVRHAGQNTAGALSDMLLKPLPGPFAVSLPYQINRDANRTLFEGAGITPHLPIPVFEPDKPQTLADGHARALDALLARIGR